MLLSKLLLLLLSFNFYNYEIAAINDSPKAINIFYTKAVKNNTVDKTLIDDKLSQVISIYYPSEKNTESYPIVVVVHGWGSNKANVSSMARYLAHSGFVCAAISVKEKKHPEDWLAALDSPFRLIEKYAAKKDSPLYKKIDFKKRVLIGHSMGGTAVLHYANRHPEITSVIALHPYNGGKGIISLVGGENKVLGDKLKNQKSYTLIISGNKDSVALPDKSYEFFKNMDFSDELEKIEVPRGSFLILKNCKHNYPIETIANLFENKKNEYAYYTYQILLSYYLLATVKNKKQFAKLFQIKSQEFQNLKEILSNYGKIPAYDFKN